MTKKSSLYFCAAFSMVCLLFTNQSAISAPVATVSQLNYQSPVELAQNWQQAFAAMKTERVAVHILHAGLEHVKKQASPTEHMSSVLPADQGASASIVIDHVSKITSIGSLLLIEYHSWGGVNQLVIKAEHVLGMYPTILPKDQKS